MHWTRHCFAAVVLVASALTAATAVATQPAVASLQRHIAVTIDDLPWATLGDETPDTLAQFHPRLVAAMKEAGVPVIGFVNEGKLVA